MVEASTENRHYDLSMLPPKPLCFDLGALHGVFAKEMSERGYRVVAFEPDPIGFGTIPKNDNVVAVKKAVGFPAGKRKFYQFLPGSGANGLYLNEVEESKNPHKEFDVDVITLQAAVDKYGRPDILKMNIEGGEVEVIMNSSDELLKSIPQMTIQFHAFAGFVTPEQEEACKARLIDLGFELSTFTHPDLPDDVYAVRAGKKAIDISYKSNPALYKDHTKCLSFLSEIKPEEYQWPDRVIKFHHYSEVANEKQLLAIESYFATQDQKHTKLVLWSDWDVKNNVLLAPYQSRIEFRVFDPIELAKGTPLEGMTDLLLATDTKHYMKSGLLRFLALCKEGGIWFDMDMVLLRDLRPILGQEFAYVWAREFKDFSKFGPCAAFMGIKAGSEHAKICLEELAKAPAIPDSVSRDCDMLAKVYARRPFTVYPSAFFNTEWQIPHENPEDLRDGWFEKTEKSANLYLDAFAWHWHGSGGTRARGGIEKGSKFDLIQQYIRGKLGASISFVFVARNDGYNDDIGAYDVPGIKEMNLERIHAVLRMLHLLGIPGQEIILIECFPPADRPSLKSMLSEYARVVTIPESVKDRLYKQTPYRMPIYEFLGKHVGALLARSNRLFFHNSDDLFRRDGIVNAMKVIDQGKIARATRIGIHPDVVRNDDLLKDLVNDTLKSPVQELARSEGAGGDYYGIRRDLYFKTGGWRVAHGEWDLDAEYLKRCIAAGCAEDHTDKFYHIEHYTAAAPQHKNSPNRPPHVSGEEHQLIEDLDSIIAEIMAYNEANKVDVRDPSEYSDDSFDFAPKRPVSQADMASVKMEELRKKYGIPEGFDYCHPDWKVPSKKNKYLAMMEEYRRETCK